MPWQQWVEKVSEVTTPPVVLFQTPIRDFLSRQGEQVGCNPKGWGQVGEGQRSTPCLDPEAIPPPKT